MAEQESDKVAAKAQDLIANLLMSAEEDIGNKISLIVQNVSQKVNIQHFVWAMMSSSKEVPDQDVSYTYTSLDVCVCVVEWI